MQYQLSVLSLEDETGSSYLVVWPSIQQAQRQPILGSTLMVVQGELRSEQGVIHVVAKLVRDYSSWLGDMQVGSRDFH